MCWLTSRLPRQPTLTPRIVASAFGSRARGSSRDAMHAVWRQCLHREKTEAAGSMKPATSSQPGPSVLDRTRTRERIDVDFLTRRRTFLLPYGPRPGTAAAAAGMSPVVRSPGCCRPVRRRSCDTLPPAAPASGTGRLPAVGNASAQMAPPTPTLLQPDPRPSHRTSPSASTFSSRHLLQQIGSHVPAFHPAASHIPEARRDDHSSLPYEKARFVPGGPAPHAIVACFVATTCMSCVYVMQFLVGGVAAACFDKPIADNGGRHRRLAGNAQVSLKKRLVCCVRCATDCVNARGHSGAFTCAGSPAARLRGAPAACAAPDATARPPRQPV